MSCAGVVLAAGHSRRFGTSNKLLATFNGSPLVTRVRDAIRGAPFDHRIVVARDDAVADLFKGFHVVAPEGDAQSDSLRAGVRCAKALGVGKIVVCLGDMPEISAELIEVVVSACTDHIPSAAFNGHQAMPPTCFPNEWFDRLMAIEGDRGAGSALAGLPPEALIPVEAATLIDVDTPADLNAAIAGKKSS